MKETKEKMQENNGITLVALVVSIVVMLVLAGVSINAVVGENGIITQAQNAAIATEEAEQYEQIQAILFNALASGYEEEEFVQYCNDQFEALGLDASIIFKNGQYILTYGINSKTIAYLDKNLNVLQTIKGVVGSSDDWLYTLNDDGTITLAKYKGSDTEITIPNIVDGYFVTILGTQACMQAVATVYDTSITSVTFSEGLIAIESKAFANCVALTTISSFPSSLETIGDEAFYNCTALSSTVSLPSNVTSVGASAFYNCENMNGTISNLLRSSVSYGTNAFYGCKKLTGDVMTALSAFLTSIDTEIPANIFYGWTGLTGTLTIESNITTIGASAFYGCTGITGIDISSASSLVTIGDSAFYGCKSMAGELNFSSYCSKLATIEASCFYGTAITSLAIPSSVTTIGDESFCGTKLTSIVLDSNGTYGSGIFSGCTSFAGGINISFGSNFKLTTLAERMFYKCTAMTSITLPSTITKIGSSCFYGCTSLTTVGYPSKLVEIGSNAFYGCSALTNLPVNSSNALISTLTTIGSSAFYATTTTDSTTGVVTYNTVLGKTASGGTTDIITLLNNSNVTSIGGSAFYNCMYLGGTIATDTSGSSVETSSIYNVSKTVISQGASVFYGTAVELARTLDLSGLTAIAANEFQGVTKFVDSTDSTKVVTEIEIPEGVTTIGAYAFDSCTSITKVTIPSTVTSIGTYAFNQCTALETVVNNSVSNLKSLGTYCFYKCSSLTSIGELSGLTSIPNYCFQYCSSLQSFKFHEGLTSLGSFSFGGTGLVTLELPSTVSSLGYQTFRDCADLAAANLSKCSAVSVVWAMFFECCSLESVSLPGACQTIEGCSFFDCVKLSTIDIPSSVTSVGQQCFYKAGLTSVTGRAGCREFGRFVLL